VGALSVGRVTFPLALLPRAAALTDPSHGRPGHFAQVPTSIVAALMQSTPSWTLSLRSFVRREILEVLSLQNRLHLVTGVLQTIMRQTFGRFTRMDRPGNCVMSGMRSTLRPSSAPLERLITC